MEEKERFFSAKRLTGFAILLALVIVLQILASTIRIGGAMPPSLVLIPIVLGGMFYGVWAGTLLGLAFGVIALICGVTGIDMPTLTFFVAHPFWTAVLCLGKGAAAGAVSGLCFQLMKKRNAHVGTFLAAASAPVVNTGLFILGAFLFLRDTITAQSAANGMTVFYFLVIGCTGVNFLVEFALNLVCAPALYTVLRVVKKGKIK